MCPNDVHAPIPGTYEYVMFHDKAELVHMEVQKAANWLSLTWKVILGYLAGPNVVTRILVTGRGGQAGQSQRQRCDNRR